MRPLTRLSEPGVVRSCVYTYEHFTGECAREVRSAIVHVCAVTSMQAVVWSRLAKSASSWRAVSGLVARSDPSGGSRAQGASRIEVGHMGSFLLRPKQLLSRAGSAISMLSEVGSSA